jgi:hypothetical protein
MTECSKDRSNEHLIPYDSRGKRYRGKEWTTTTKRSVSTVSVSALHLQ